MLGRDEAKGAPEKSRYDDRMAQPRTARLGARALVVGACAVLAACGFTGLGAAPVAGDSDAGASNGNGNGNGSSDGATGDGNPAFGAGGSIVVGGDGASAEDAAIDADGSAPDGAPFTCPSGCTSCTGTTCNILCDGTHPCSSPIACPPGVPCHVTCDATGVCSQHNISCAKASSCRVDCTQFHACQMMGVDCGGGACRLDCLNFTEACTAVNLNAPNAASLCLQCDVIGGDPGCKATDGTKPSGGRPCDLVCGGGGCNANGNGLNGCTSAAACP